MDESIFKRRRRVLLLALLYVREKKKKERNILMKRRRKYWVHPILQLKQQQGDWNNLIYEMRLQDDETFFNYMRMTPRTFDNLLSKVGPLIKKMDTHLRLSIPAAARLSITIRYLATGDGLQSIALCYRIGRSTISAIIKETCEAIWDCFHTKQLLTPAQDKWREIAVEFENVWNFPNCIGALDGKHIAIICPEKAGSSYYNYKGFHSIVLLALVSASYKFLIVDIGAQGKHSDGGIFRHSIMGQRFYNKTMNLPHPSAISTKHNVPYVMVADEAFQLNFFTMRPYPSKNLNKQKRIFNYRLSRARRVVENAFGILASRWRIFHKPLNTSLETCDAIVKATVCLHNILMDISQPYGKHADKVNINGEIIEGEWRKDINVCFLNDGTIFGSNNHTQHAGEIRNTFADYFINEGRVPWQEQLI